MSSYKVEICGVNTSKLPILKEEEKVELFKRIKEGDSKAREIYIEGNLRLVLSVIRRFVGNSENADDLFQIGCIGLIKSIDNFEKTAYNSTYIYRSLRKRGVRANRQQRGQAHRLQGRPGRKRAECRFGGRR